MMKSREMDLLRSIAWSYNDPLGVVPNRLYMVACSTHCSSHVLMLDQEDSDEYRILHKPQMRKVVDAGKQGFSCSLPSSP